MAKVELIGVPDSTYTRAVRIALGEKGVAYELTVSRPHTPPVDAVHPLGKVPVMRHGDFELCESRAIVAYLDREFPGPKLMPEDPREAAVAEQWISLFNTAFDQTIVRTYVLNHVFPKGPNGTIDRAAIDAAVPVMRDQLKLLDKAVAKTGYLAGASFTFADMNLIPPLFWLQKFPEGAQAMAQAKSLSAYYAKHSARPAVKATEPQARAAA